ncbi:MAG: hypothetical protein AABM66_01280 [Actinomycetota bacterium]
MIPDGTHVRLTAGGHSSPREGVCVVELASLLAQEEFSDRPRCVCPVIGAFMRGWNDRAPYAERQRLSPYAERIVGSRSSSTVTRERRDLCLRWAGADLSHGAIRRLWCRAGMRVRIAIFCGPGAAVRPNEGAGDYAARVAMARDDADGAFELLDALLAVGGAERLRPPPYSADGNGHAPLNGNGLPAVNGNAPAGNGAAPQSRVPALSSRESAE